MAAQHAHGSTDCVHSQSSQHQCQVAMFSCFRILEALMGERMQ